MRHIAGVKRNIRVTLARRSASSPWCGLDIYYADHKVGVNNSRLPVQWCVFEVSR